MAAVAIAAATAAAAAAPRMLLVLLAAALLALQLTPSQIEAGAAVAAHLMPWLLVLAAA
jgi:hypothetical protein